MRLARHVQPLLMVGSVRMVVQLLARPEFVVVLVQTDTLVSEQNGVYDMGVL